MRRKILASSSKFLAVMRHIDDNIVMRNW